MRRTRLVGGPWSMFCHRLQRPRLTALTRPNLPRQNGSSGSYCLHAATGFPQPVATGHCSHRLERELLPSCSYRLSTTSGHRPLQPQAFHNYAAAGHCSHWLSMRPHAVCRKTAASNFGAIGKGLLKDMPRDCYSSQSLSLRPRNCRGRLLFRVESLVVRKKPLQTKAASDDD